MRCKMFQKPFKKTGEWLLVEKKYGTHKGATQAVLQNVTTAGNNNVFLLYINQGIWNTGLGGLVVL